jgi:FlgO protein
MREILRQLPQVALACLLLTGCVTDGATTAASSTAVGAAPFGRGQLGTLTYRAVDIILASAPQVTGETPLIVASIADVEHIERSSALGNIVADMIRTRIVQDGHSATEIRLRREIGFNHGEGEFLLSRDRRALMAAPSAGAIVTGTYAASAESVYVSLKLVSATDARILAGADFVVPIREVVGLLHAT